LEWLRRLAHLFAPRKPRLTKVDIVMEDDDAVACLAMILRHRRAVVPIDEIRAAIYSEGSALPTALDIVRAARHFGLPCRGVRPDVGDLRFLPLPCVAHLRNDEGPYPRIEREGMDGSFVLVEALGREMLSIIDPKQKGRRLIWIDAFLRRASGIFLLFDSPGRHPARRARLASVAR